MKRTRGFGFALILTLLLSLLPFSSLAVEDGVRIEGPSTVRAGDRITLTVRLKGENLFIFLCDLTYDPGKLSFSHANSLLDSWEVTVNDDENGHLTVLLSNENQDRPLTGEKQAVSFVFRVKESLSVGTSLRVTFDQMSASDGEEDTVYDDLSYQTDVARPRSSNADLSSLYADATTLTPEFDKDITEYTAATVPFDMLTLPLHFETADENARVTVSGNTLIVGENLVTLTVTAEDGSEKVYRIHVEREQDPNYVPSGDSFLVDITLSAGSLSPVFVPDNTDYLVTVSFETTVLTATGIPRHPLAIGCESETVTLAPGENTLTLICRAEDGSATAYTIHIIRMPSYEGYLPQVTPGTAPPPETEPPASTPPESAEPGETGKDESEAPPKDTAPHDTDPSEGTTPGDALPLPSPFADQTVLIYLALTGMVALGLGLIIGALLARPKKYKYKKR